MEKMKMHSADITDTNIEKIGKLFPNCLTERIVGYKDITRPDGTKEPIIEQVIDFDMLRQELSKDIVEGPQERYHFTWPDKKKAIRLANAPSTMTLRPCREESVDFDNTENLYIEGDNLEVLKLLREDYLGKVKMIYIDPPYNTGNDFVYEDDFSQAVGDYVSNSGQIDAEGNKLVQNTESNGRFHTDWLNMIYPRLKVARDLLSEDGVIFISIDDNELDNLKKVCDEVFGASNFIDVYNWAKTETPENLSIKCRQIIEYVICYQKRKDKARFQGLNNSSTSSNGLLNQPNALGVLKFPANKVITNIPDGIIPAGMYGTDKYDVELLNDVKVEGGLFVEEFALKARFKWSQSYLKNEMDNGTIISIPTIKLSPAYVKKEYAPEVPTNLINSKVGVETNENAGEYQLQLFDKKVFNFPKPTSLMQYLFGFLSTPEGFTVMDFFSGSASTAEAVMRMNIERDEPIKYIMVQIQEDLEKAKAGASSKSQKEVIQNAIDLCDGLGRPKNICEVAKERIRRAGKKILEEMKADAGEGGLFAQAEEENPKLDVGFRVLKLDSSNMEDVYYRLEDSSEATLFEDNVKPDRTGEDLLFQVMLECNLPLSAKIQTEKIAGKEVFSVNNGYLIACFDEDVNEEVITTVAKRKPYYFIMRDKSLSTDNVADNFEQIFQAYSKETIRRIL